MRLNNDMKKLIFIGLVIILAFTLVAQAHAEGCGFIEIKGIGRYDLVYTGNQMNLHQHIALLYKTYGAQTVGNHYGSQSLTGGQWKLENVKVGDKAHLEYLTGNGNEFINHSYDYVCYAVMICDVVDMKFYHNGKEVRPYDETDLICCTCVVSDSTRNYVCFFEVVQ